jgi:hypothetical protein
MRRTFLLGLLAIALFAGTGMGLTWWMTRGEPRVIESQPVVAEPSPMPPPVLPERRPAPEPAAQGSVASVAESARIANEVNAPPTSPRGSKAYLSPGTRRAPRGATNGFMASLGALQPRIAACASGTAPLAPGGRPPGPAILMLDLEQQKGAVKVVDASVHSKGQLSDETVACAQGILVGQVLKVAEARPGKNLRVPYPLRF